MASCAKAAEIVARMKTKGKNIDKPHLFIASTALYTDIAEQVKPLTTKILL